MQTNKKITIWIVGLLSMSMAILLSLVYAKQRIAFGDAAYQLFSILRTQDFAIQVLRFGSGITQVFPMLGSYLKLNLGSIVVLYSLSFELISLAVLLALLLYFKDYGLAIALILLKTLITTHTFFWVQSELLQGLVILVLFLAWIKDKSILQFSIVQYCVFFVLVFTLVFFHPLILFSFLFCMAYIWMFHPGYAESRTIKLSIVLFLLLTGIKSVLLKNAYDSGAMSGLANFKSLFPHYFATPLNKLFLQNCSTNFVIWAVATLLLSILLLKAKKWKQFLFWGFSSLAYFILIQITNYNDIEHFYRVESFYMPLVLMLGFVVSQEMLNEKLSLSIFLLLTFTSLGWFTLRINATSEKYTQQLKWNTDFVNNHFQTKLVINENELPKDTLLLPWAFPYQSWIISTIEKGNTASFAVSPDPHSFDWILYAKASYITQWGIFDYSQMPSQYFILKNDSVGYSHYQPE